MRRFNIRGVHDPLGELFWIVIILLGIAYGLLRLVVHFAEAVSKRDWVTLTKFAWVIVFVPASIGLGFFLCGNGHPGLALVAGASVLFAPLLILRWLDHGDHE